jgi:hypothetical protein
VARRKVKNSTHGSLEINGKKFTEARGRMCEVMVKAKKKKSKHCKC